MITDNPLLAARNILRTIPDELLKLSKDGFYALDREFKYIYWSEGMRRITGLSSEEIRGQHAFKVFPFLQEIGQDKVLEAVFRGESIQAGIRKFKIMQTGRVGYFESRYYPLRGINAEVIGALAVITDMTEQKLIAEMQAETESRFRKMAESSPVMLWMSGQDGLCTFFNQSWLEFSGRTIEQEWGVGWAEGVHAFDFQHCMDTYSNNFRMRTPFEMEYRLLRSDGVYRWILDRGVPRYSPDGIFEGYIGSCIDITERKMLEEELRKSIRQREEFLSIASHELRTPLTSLGLQVQILNHMIERTADLNQLRDQVTPMLEIADRQLKHMSDLIEKLLDVSRIETGSFKMDIAATDLVQVTNEVADRFMLLAKQADCTITIGGEKSVIGDWDRSRIFQVISNLFANAIKYASGSTIDVKIECDGKKATLNISDQGPGIEEASLPRIFEKFQRARNSPHAGGLGLGLFLVKQIVQGHGGQVTAENLQPRGARFLVDLPLTSVELRG